MYLCHDQPTNTCFPHSAHTLFLPRDTFWMQSRPKLRLFVGSLFVALEAEPFSAWEQGM